MMPEFRRGPAGARFALALVATAGRVVVPIAVQQTIDRGLTRAGGPGPAAWSPGSSLLCAVVVADHRRRRLPDERPALPDDARPRWPALRVRAFRHVHDLSVLHQQAERRGSLVSRVTSDVDQMSGSCSGAACSALVSLGQLVVATVVMAVYSWQLTLLVLACFVPLGIAVRWFASAAGRRLRRGPRADRRRARRGRRSRSSARRRSAPTASRGRTAARIDAAIDRHYRAAGRRAEDRPRAVFVSGEFVAGAGQRRPSSSSACCSASAGDITAGTLVAFLFLVTLFVAPVQIATEVLNEAQNALAGFRRVLDVLDTEPDVARPGDRRPDGVHGCPPGRSASASTHVTFRYAPAAPGRRCDDVDLTIAPRTPGGDRRRDRLGQDDLRQAAHPADGPDRGPGAARLGRAGWVPLTRSPSPRCARGW